jgi:hypothetical protein
VVFDGHGNHGSDSRCKGNGSDNNRARENARTFRHRSNVTDGVSAQPRTTEPDCPETAWWIDMVRVRRLVLAGVRVFIVSVGAFCRTAPANNDAPSRGDGVFGGTHGRKMQALRHLRFTVIPPSQAAALASLPRDRRVVAPLYAGRRCLLAIQFPQPLSASQNHLGREL